MANNMKNEYLPDYVSPPGDTLLETLESLGMSQTELAKRMGRPIKTINEIVKGKAAITPETALQLEKVFGVPARFWNNRERLYREALAREAEQKQLQEDLAWLKSIPVSEMIKNEWISKEASKIEQLTTVLRFFGVAGIGQWRDIWTEPLVAYRESPVFKSRLGALSAWLRKGQLGAQQLECSPYKKQVFKERLSAIRGLTKESNPDTFVPLLVDWSAQAGVAVVFVTELKGVRVSGATYWLTAHKPVIQLNLRYKTNDHLWFTFFHEAAHILLHKKRLIVEDLDGKKEIEDEANTFSGNFLVDQKRYQQFVTGRKFSKVSVKNFADEVDIAPGIVVGRLQHDGHLPFTHLNGFKIHYSWN